MNRALLDDLQGRHVYPSITVLVNTPPDTLLGPDELSRARRLAAHAIRRLDGDVGEGLRAQLERELAELIDTQSGTRASKALALCVSPDHSAAVKLGRPVEERVVIDDTFATRDLVADLNRTARYRVVTISDRKARLLVGDHTRVVEERVDGWPMIRADAQSTTSWNREVAKRLRDSHAASPLPTVVAGVGRTVRDARVADSMHVVGHLRGAHDRTSWSELHAASWPLVAQWLGDDGRQALDALARARSTSRFAGGLDEVWSLARRGQVDTVVVEQDFSLAARVANDHLEPTDDREAPDVVDDVVDDTIEAVLRAGGRAVVVDDDSLREYGRIAAVLRY